MAYPDSWIYHLGEEGIQRIAYEETEHYRVTRMFLNRSETMLATLMGQVDRNLAEERAAGQRRRPG